MFLYRKTACSRTTRLFARPGAQRIIHAEAEAILRANEIGVTATTKTNLGDTKQRRVLVKQRFFMFQRIFVLRNLETNGQRARRVVHAGLGSPHVLYEEHDF